MLSYEISNERGTWEMKNKPKEKEELKVSFSKRHKSEIIVGVIVGVIVYIITTVIGGNLGFVKDIVSTPRKIDDIKDEIVGLRTDLENEDKKLDRRITELEERTFTMALELTYNDPIKVEQDSVTNEARLANPTWKDSEIIAKDLKTGTEYRANQLVGQKLLLSYKEDEQDVIFYGQFNENNHWDKDCLINVYENGILSFVMEAEYEDGKLLRYSQITPYTTKSNNDVWIVSEREAIDDYNYGDSWNYYREGDYKEEFDLEKVSLSNLIEVEEFKKYMGNKLEGYYHGKTSDGCYNDDTGEAYLVKYFPDGRVRTLYSGKFEDGNFEDSTYNAWYITKEEDTPYMYYKGKFENGSAKKDKNSTFQYDLTQDDINDIIKGKTFNCELIWK